MQRFKKELIYTYKPTKQVCHHYTRAVTIHPDRLKICGSSVLPLVHRLTSKRTLVFIGSLLSVTFIWGQQGPWDGLQSVTDCHTRKYNRVKFHRMSPCCEWRHTLCICSKHDLIFMVHGAHEGNRMNQHDMKVVILHRNRESNAREWGCEIILYL